MPSTKPLLGGAILVYFVIAFAHDPDWIIWGMRFAGAGAGALKACLYGLALLGPAIRTRRPSLGSPE